MTRRYGYVRDAPDHRDYGVHKLDLVVKLPASADLEAHCGPVKDQGDLGACTAFAGTGMREFLARAFQSQSPVLSPLFLYYNERVFDGSLGQGDTGSTGRSSVHVLNTIGVCPEAEDPYAPAEFEVAPTPAQIAAAAIHRSGAYHRLSNVQDMKACLASGYVFVVGFSVYASFESNWHVPGYMPIPKLHESVLGGHEVLFIGYDDSKSAFKVRNSWGSDWGLSGNFWFPYAAAADPDILQDAWMTHLGHAWK